MKIGIVQSHLTCDRSANRQHLSEYIRSLAAKGARLIVLSELHDSLYFCQTENVDNCDLAEPVPGPSTDYYGSIAKELGVVMVISLYEKRAAGVYCNTAVVLEKDGSIAGRYRKMHIPDDPGYYEKFYFTPGDLGFHPIDTSVGRIGLLVCWDQWFPEAARLMALQGAELLIYPTAIGYDQRDTPEEQERQREAWTIVQRGHAVANGLPVVTVNRVGFELESEADNASRLTGVEDSDTVSTDNSQLINAGKRGIEFWGSSFVAGPQGELLYRSPKDREDAAIIDVDLKHSEQVRRWWPFLRDRRIDAYDGLLKRLM